MNNEIGFQKAFLERCFCEGCLLRLCIYTLFVYTAFSTNNMGGGLWEKNFLKKEKDLCFAQTLTKTIFEIKKRTKIKNKKS